ncbi:MAG TPA: hypothetical protein VFB45_26580 [Pseudolabrys sp.]|nr:hypothetical protein [Pseudolabrys sp.]
MPLAADDKAAEYRRQAAACLQVAERMSMDSDRRNMVDMAFRWLKLAEEADNIATGKNYKFSE